MAKVATIVLISLLLVVVQATQFSFPPFPAYNESGLICYKDAAIRNGDELELNANARDRKAEDSTGWGVYSYSIPLWDKSSGNISDFSSHFQFVIRTFSQDSSDDGGSQGSSGDGMAFFMAPVNTTPPDSSESHGGFLGLFNNSTNGSLSTQIVAVEFDTYKNSYDPNNNHVGIDIDSSISVTNIPLSFSLLATDEAKRDAWVDYDGQLKKLQVFLSNNSNTSSKPPNPILSYEVDLRDYLPQNIIVGFSAATGAAAEIHKVLSWEFSSNISWKDSSVNNKSSAKIVLIIVFVWLAAFCVCVFCCARRFIKTGKFRNGAGQASDGSDVELDQRFSQGPRKFTYAQLTAATRNFSPHEKLGQGGFGGVYRGILAETNETVAVKRISPGSKQGKKEYVSEVTIISRLRHRNLVQLIGWCHEKGELLLVYEYMPNGSLDNHIFGSEARILLDWNARYKIACGLASALLYLHEEWDQCVVHRDVKSSNVMLDSNFNAKLGDFGLARLVEHDGGSQTTVVAGTWGYLAPECVITGKSSAESDVFSFGAVALEIACGRRPVDEQLEAYNKRLVEWVWDHYGQGTLLECADEILRGDCEGNAGEMEQLMVVGLWCSHPDPTARPTMRQVLKMLNFESPLPHLPPKVPVAMYAPLLHPGGLSTASSSMPSLTYSSKAASSSTSDSNCSISMSKALLHHQELHS